MVCSAQKETERNRGGSFIQPRCLGGLPGGGVVRREQVDYVSASCDPSAAAHCCRALQSVCCVHGPALSRGPPPAPAPSPTDIHRPCRPPHVLALPCADCAPSPGQGSSLGAPHSPRIPAFRPVSVASPSPAARGLVQGRNLLSLSHRSLGCAVPLPGTCSEWMHMEGGPRAGGVGGD